MLTTVIFALAVATAPNVHDDINLRSAEVKPHGVKTPTMDQSHNMVMEEVPIEVIELSPDMSAAPRRLADDESFGNEEETSPDMSMLLPELVDIMNAHKNEGHKKTSASMSARLMIPLLMMRRWMITIARCSKRFGLVWSASSPTSR